jgi:hypothetical protein
MNTKSKYYLVIGAILIVILYVYNKANKMEASFRGGRGGRLGGRGRWGGWGYPYYGGFGYPYDYFNEPVIIENKKCPEGFVFRGEKDGCKKISEIA